MPELPQLEMGLVPAASRYVTKKWQDCNWVQSVEGALDTSHFSFLHAVLCQGRRHGPRRPGQGRDRRPVRRPTIASAGCTNDPRPKFTVHRATMPAC